MAILSATRLSQIFGCLPELTRLRFVRLDTKYGAVSSLSLQMRLRALSLSFANWSERDQDCPERADLGTFGVERNCRQCASIAE
jgi:hypothetical protein